MAKSYLKRKEKIIITAIDILDQGGINGLTMKEIANQQGITEPAVYRQFNNKREIVHTILERFSAFDLTLMNTIRQGDLPVDQAIEYFFESYVTYYENYPQLITVLFSFDVYRYEAKSNQLMKGILARRKQFIASLIREGVGTGLFASEDEAEAFGEMLLGQLWASMYDWKQDHCSWNLKDQVMKRTRWMLSHMKINHQEESSVQEPRR